MGTDDRDIISNLFFSVADNDFNLKNLGNDWFNKTFGLAMQNGAFRFFAVRFFCLKNIPQDTNAVLPIQDECIKILRENLKGLCHDILLANDFLLCNGLVNYPSEKEPQLRCALESSLAAIKKFSGAAANAAMGLSLPYKKIVDTGQARMQAMEAIWLSVSKDMGSVIEWEKDRALTASCIKTMEKYKRTLKKACSVLDAGTFLKTYRDFCSLPRRILTSMETRALLYEVEHYMYEVNHKFISEFADASVIHASIQEAHRKAVSPDEFFDSYGRIMGSLFEKIIKYAPKNYKLVRQAEYFVQTNVSKGVSLNDAADEVSLNAVYFSHLYKKATGMNFTDYVIRCKIDAAKIYLTQEKMNIKNIAKLTGFSDAKYFSRKFKEKEKVSPSDYRKFHV